MSAAVDTSRLLGGPLKRYGGKGQNAPLLVPHFARATLYVEPCFGAGSVFYRLPPGTYEREVINDVDRSVVTFFRVLRDRTDELVRACELTPYARDEFATALVHSDDELEEARRVWVRGRQGFAGRSERASNWGRDTGDGHNWNPRQTEAKLDELGRYAARLRGVVIDHVDAAEFVDRWGQRGAFVYVDPPYVASVRKGRAYAHEMDEADHRHLATALHHAADQGAHVAISGYPSPLYDELFDGWRSVSVDVPLHGVRNQRGQRRTERLWMSYPPERELAHVVQPSLFAAGAGAAR